MLERLMSNGARTIIVESPDRFARDLMVQLAGHHMLKARGVTLIAASAPMHFIEDTPPQSWRGRSWARSLSSRRGTRPELDRAGLLRRVQTFNLHPHLPHLELPETDTKMEVLARQAISPTAPPHPFVQAGHTSFNALLQTRPGVFAGTLLACDATLWSAAFQGLESLEALWQNLASPSK
jgi:hypothetical protein